MSHDEFFGTDDVEDALPTHTLADESAIPEAGFLGRLIQKGGVFVACLVSRLRRHHHLRSLHALRRSIAPTIWVTETTIFLCALAFIYGGLYAVARDRHIRVVLIYNALPPGWRRVFDIGISILCLISATFFAWASWTWVAAVMVGAGRQAAPAGNRKRLESADAGAAQGLPDGHHDRHGDPVPHPGNQLRAAGPLDRCLTFPRWGSPTAPCSCSPCCSACCCSACRWHS